MFRFRIRTLLLLTAGVAILLGGYQLWTGPTLNERLQAAAEAGQHRRFEWLIWLGAEVDEGLGSHSYGGTPMMWRANAGDLWAVRMYVEHGAYHDHTEKDGFTAGTLAAWNGHWDVVEYLVRSGANFRIPDGTGRTVVNYAVESEKQDILELLHAKPTPLAHWRIEATNFPLRGSDSESYNRAYRVIYRMAGEQWGETAVTWFQALVEEEGGQETIVSGPIDLRFAPDGNSLTVTYADGRVEKLFM